MRLARARPFLFAPWPALFAASAVGGILSAHNDAHDAVAAFCTSGQSLAVVATRFSAALQMTLLLTPPLQLTMFWALMLVAMMPPLLATPLMHVWNFSLPSRRVSAVTLFLLAYVAVWMAVGPMLMGMALLLQQAAPPTAFAIALGAAVVWISSPWHRVALNRAHRLKRIGMFGWSARRDCLMFGLTHGLWCVASCWIWMVVPLVSGSCHWLVMMLAAVIMLIERLAAPDRPRWREPTVVRCVGRWGKELAQRGDVAHG